MLLKKLNSLSELFELRDNLFALSIQRFGWSHNAKKEKANEITSALLKVFNWDTAKALIIAREQNKTKSFSILPIIYIKTPSQKINIQPLLVNVQATLGDYSVIELLNKLLRKDKTVITSIFNYFSINNKSMDNITFNRATIEELTIQLSQT